MISVVAAAFLLTFVVVVHEAGHYLVARWHGLNVTVFSVGFGKELIGYTDKRGTRWRFSAIPLGGYVQLPENEESSSQNTFNLLHPWRRITFLMGGPLANALLACLLWLVCAGIWLPSPVHITHIAPNSPAAHSGLRSGDIVLDGALLSLSPPSQVKKDALENQTEASAQLFLKIRRNHHHMALNVPLSLPKVTPLPSPQQLALPLELANHLGIHIQHITSTPLITNVTYATCEALTVSYTTLSGLWRVVCGPSKESHKLLGPLGIMTLSSKIWTLGFKPFLHLMASISLILGLTNLLPIPVLDGGGIAACLGEWITGKPLSEKTQTWLLRIGIALLGLVFLTSSWSDIQRLFRVF